MFAVIRVRGTANVSRDLRHSLETMRLIKPNHCIILPENEYSSGMLRKVKDYVTWGKISDDTLKKLVKARGEGVKEKEIPKHIFRLAPPKKGFERAGIKKAFTQGGVLGDRKEKINELIERMI